MQILFDRILWANYTVIQIELELAMPKKKPLTQRTLYTYYKANGKDATRGYGDCLRLYMEHLENMYTKCKSVDEFRTELISTVTRMSFLSCQLSDLVKENSKHFDNIRLKEQLNDEQENPNLILKVHEIITNGLK
ncbi:MAG: hypothetical protein J0H92_19380 [Sphingobacteriales bacterium]|nr:hypothetical protein [Sphingobacteriales bacterium]OJW32085.1 MAG: hypothetical protein BGO54_16865 [Sphingobacteriales bacterium 46-32]